MAANLITIRSAASGWSRATSDSFRNANFRALINEIRAYCVGSSDEYADLDKAIAAARRGMPARLVDGAAAEEAIRATLRTPQ